MAKTVKAKKVKGLDIVIGDMIVNHLKKAFLKKKESPKAVKLNVQPSKPKPVPKSPKAKAPKETPEVHPEPHVAEPAAPTPEPEPAPKVRSPYREINVASGDIKRTKESGEYIHPIYKFGTPLHHEGHPHTGTVHYVATFSAGGEPLVQPIDDNGQHVGKTFQANPKKLSEK